MVTKLTNNPHISRIENGNGGNPEVYNKKITLCFSLKNRAKAKCLEQIYKDIDIVVIQEKNNKPLLLAGRGTFIKKKIQLLKTDKRVLFYLNTQNVKKPIQANIERLKKSNDGEILILDIAKKDIKDTLILKDRDGKTLLQYRVIQH
jgi:hypothetical protein